MRFEQSSVKSSKYCKPTLGVFFYKGIHSCLLVIGVLLYAQLCQIQIKCMEYEVQ